MGRKRELVLNLRVAGSGSQLLKGVESKGQLEATVRVAFGPGVHQFELDHPERRTL